MAWVYLEMRLLPLEISHLLIHALGHNGNLRMSDPATFAFSGMFSSSRDSSLYACVHI